MKQAKQKQKVSQAMAILVIGLMLTTISPLIASKFNFPDIARGGLVGFGIGLELVAAITLIKLKKAQRTS